MPSVHSVLCTAYLLLTLPARLVTWWLYFIPTSNRPNPAWSWKTTISVHSSRLFLKHLAAIRYRFPKLLEPGAEGDRFIVLSPQRTLANTELPVYQGTVTSIPAIQPVRIGAVWYPAAPVEPPKKVIIYFHPSAYVLFGPRPGDMCSWGVEKFSELSGWPILSIQYRLALDADKTFPAALQDAITAYVYALETLKISPSQIVLAGESAGASLVLALLRYIDMENQALPSPRSALLFSPWVDMTHETLLASMTNPNYKTDFVGYEFASWGATSYIPPGWSERNPYFTPLGSEYKLNVPIFVEAGTSELLYDDIMQFVQNTKEKGTEVELHEAPNAPHIIFSSGANMAMLDVAIDGHARASRFMEKTGPAV